MEIEAQSYREIPFRVELPCSLFEKADAPEGRKRRIGGVISTERQDKQGDTVVQRGLDFSDFLKSGWFNWNHDKGAGGMLGYPESVQVFQKGQKLPDGKSAVAACTWAEGYLLEGFKPADQIWELGKALQGTGRTLGYSVEGAITRRTGPLRKTIAKAKVREVAITKCPVNTDTSLTILAKSLDVAESMAPGDLDELVRAEGLDERLSRIEGLLKALTVGTPTNPGGTPADGAKTGEGAAHVLAVRSLDHDAKVQEDDEDEDEAITKSLTDSEAIAWALRRAPTMSRAAAERFVTITRRRKRHSRL